MSQTANDSGSSPSDLITRYEGILRELIRSVLGSDWQDKTGLDIAKLREKWEYERRRRRGVAVPDDLLAFTEHLELVKIINKRWERFAGILGDRKRWTVYSDRIASIRNAPMHGRQLLHFEQQLLAGMTGEIGNIVAQYRSSQGPDAAWYPVVESITDNFGNDIWGRTFNILPTRLAVGDTIRFTCVGLDPQDRTLTWELRRSGGNSRQLDEAQGARAELTWIVAPIDVSERTNVVISMTSAGPYHRSGDYDDAVLVGYPVSPPPA